MNPPSLPRTAPRAHREFATRAVEHLARDRRILGVAAAGSWATDRMDEFSDLDLLLAIEDEHAAAMLGERLGIAGALGPLLAAFTGEHVGEPRLLICLYGPPVLHVDLKFVAITDAAARVDEPRVLWERDGRLSAALRGGRASYPSPDPQWIEDRFWVWIHYVTTKVARGELFEAIEFLSFLRQTVLGPLGLQQLGLVPAGVRRVEAVAPRLAADLLGTVALHDAASCYAAIGRCVALYRELRPGLATPRSAAEAAAVDYLEQLRAGGPASGDC